MTEPNQRDLFGGEALKAEGMDQVLENSREEWKARVAACITQLAVNGDPFTGDHVRALARLRGIPEPHHPNAWGAAMNAAAQRKVIVKTGRYVKSETVTRHAAIVAEWVGEVCRGGES